MSKINFYLKGALSASSLEELKAKKANSNLYNDYLKRPLPLVLYLSINGQRIQIPMGFSVPPRFWNFKTQEIKTSVDTPSDLEKKNKEIADVYKKLTDLIETSKTDRTILRKEQIIALIKNKNYIPPSAFQETGLSKMLQYFIDNYRMKNGFPLGENSVKTFKTIQNQIDEFLPEFYPKFGWSDIDMLFMQRYQDWLYDKKNLVDNSAAKCLKKFLQFLRFVEEQGIQFSKEVRKDVFKFRVSEHEIPVIIVELAELEHLYSYDFKDEHLGRVRDLFVFMAWTGQRYSDYIGLKRCHLTKRNGIDVWEVTTKKTKDASITVPLNEIALGILSKYEEEIQPLPIFSEQHFNRSLKDMAGEVELNRIVKVIESRRGNIEQKDFALRDVLTSHVARKSYITNSLILGMSEREVKAISGHKDDRSFRRYVNLSSSVLATAKQKQSRANILEKIEFLKAV
ncbi:MAG: tyrosine-type recombinase/integrase [Bacteroidota bacterium]|nr:tyrosine-type recombinase/integrase [Bacteroidota bacterium]